MLLSAGGIAYLLRDLFTSALAAGSVNGTAAEPGPGTRVVVDVGSNLSITAGALVVAGNVGGNPSLTYTPTIVRAFGRCLFYTLAGAGDMRAAWLNSTNPSTGREHFIYAGAAVITAGVGTTDIVLNVNRVSPLDCCIVLRTTGAYYFYKSTNWTLIWVDATRNNTLLTVNAIWAPTNAAATSDNVRVPVPLYSVPVLAYDTFTRANGTLGSSEAVGPDSQAVTARAWMLQAGTIVIDTNRASLTVLSGTLNAIATVDGVSSDVLVDVNVTRTLGSGGSVLRYVDANNYLRASHDGTNALIEQVVAGTPTTLRTGVATYSAGATLRVIVSGTTGWLFYNGVAVGASFTVPASSATLHGLYGLDLSCLWDNFQIMARGTGKEYAYLDTL